MNQSHHHIDSHGPVRCGRIFFVLLVSSIAISVSYAQSSFLDVRAGAVDTMIAKPGTIVTIPIRLTSTAEHDVAIQTILQLPSGWRLVAPIPRVMLPASSHDVILAIVGIPREAAAQLHEIGVKVIADGDSSAASTVRTFVLVEKVQKAAIILVDAPRYTVAGGRVPFTYDVINRGNDTISLLFEGRSSRGFSVSIDPPDLSIPPSGSARVVALVQTVSDQASTVQHTLEFFARPADGGPAVSLTTATDVVPMASNAEPRRVEYPVYARLRVANERGLTALQGEIAGFGSLREDGSDKLEILLRAPETQTLSVLGHRDEYRVRYRQGRHEVYVGDWNYALTTLTEIGRYAFGAGGSTAIGDATMGGFTNSTRIGEPNQRELGGFFRYAITPDVEAGVNVLNMTGKSSADIVTLNTTASLFEGAILDAEGGKSSGSRGTDFALAMRLKGRLPWLAYDARVVNAGPEYGGYYRDVRFSQISLTGYADRDVRVELSARKERRNLNADTLAGSAPVSDYAQIGVGYSNYFAVYLRQSNIEDPLSSSPYDRREDIVQFRASYPISFGNVSAYADFGTLSDHTLGLTGPTRRYAASVNLLPVPRQSYGVSTEYTSSRDLYLGGDQDRFSVSLLASYILGERTQANINVFNTRATGLLPQTYTLVDASVDHVFPFNHRLQVRLRRSTLSGSTPETAVSLDYGIPLAIPLGRINASGTLSGRLVDSGGHGISEALISLGSTGAVTDEEGRFVFVDLEPNNYFLSIDRSSIGLNMITTTPLPLEVRVIGGEETRVDLSIIPAATINGTLHIFDLNESTDVDSASIVERVFDGSASLAVELSNGEEVLRRTTDSRGRFLFTDVRPGHWTLTFTPRSLPSEHSLETVVQEINVTAGSTMDVHARVVPRRKVIRIVQEGGVLGIDSLDRVREEFVGEYIVRQELNGEIVVQISAWKFEDKALVELVRVKSLTTMRAWIDPEELPDIGLYYRVLVGPFASVNSAKEFCRELINK